jgi:hypothetical protein
MAATDFPGRNVARSACKAGDVHRCCTDIVEANQLSKMRTIRIQSVNPINSFTFPASKTATQSHWQTNMLFWLDFLCNNLVYPCNTPAESCLYALFGEAMDQALLMPLAWSRERWFNMMDVLRGNDITRCSERFVTTLPSVA